MGKRKPQYTGEEAKGRIPIMAKRVALSAVDLVIQLEVHPIDSYELESRIWSLTGQVGYLNRLFHTYWKAEGLKKAKAEGAD